MTSVRRMSSNVNSQGTRNDSFLCSVPPHGFSKKILFSGKTNDVSERWRILNFAIIQIDVSVDIWIHWSFVVSPPLSFFVLNSRHLRSYFFFFSWFSWIHCSNFEKTFVFSEVTPTFLSRRYSCILTLSSFQSDVRPFFLLTVSSKFLTLCCHVLWSHVSLLIENKSICIALIVQASRSGIS